VIFAPIAFLSGITGQVFREFGLVIVAAVLFSLLVSFTLTPMLASRWLRAPRPDDRALLARFGRAWEAGYSRVALRYRALLAWSLRHRWPVIAAGVASLATGVLLVVGSFVGTEFVPESDQSLFTLQAEMPPGTPLEATDRALSVVEARLAAWPEVERTFISVGVAGENHRQAGDQSPRQVTSATNSRREVLMMASVPRARSTTTPRSPLPSMAGADQLAQPLCSRGMAANAANRLLLSIACIVIPFISELPAENPPIAAARSNGLPPR